MGLRSTPVTCKMFSLASLRSANSEQVVESQFSNYLCFRVLVGWEIVSS